MRRKLNFTKLIASLLVVSSLITVMPVESYAETVNNQANLDENQANLDEKGVWVSKKSKYSYNLWYKIGDSWATGWKKIDGNWRYFYSDGSPAVATPERGSGWKQIDGKWYNFGSNGVMNFNSIIVDYPNEYYVGEDGELCEMPTSGWLRKQIHPSDVWRYRVNNSWAKGWQLIDGNWYYFYDNGDMMTNCTQDEYRAGEDGVCVPV